MAQRTLHGAVSGKHVAALQESLRRLDLDPGRTDGIFGFRTAAAVRTYQRSKGLQPDGVVGRQTWTELASEAGSPLAGLPLPDAIVGATSGDEVQEVQTALQQAGFSPGRIDAVYGPDTARAVRDFQYVHALVTDGEVGPATREALLQQRLALSPSVVTATRGLARPVVASELTGRVLTAHTEYAGGRRPPRLAADPAEVALTCLRWLREVRTLFSTLEAPVLHGRLLVLGLALLDRGTGAALRADGFLELLTGELAEPLDSLLTPRARLLRARADSSWQDLGRLSASSRAAMSSADAFRRASGSTDLHMEHLLAGCLSKRGGPADTLLGERLGPDGFAALVAATVGTALPTPAAPVVLEHLPPLSEHVAQALDHAYRLADAVGSSSVRTRFVLHGALTVRTCTLIAALEDRGVQAADVSGWDEPTASRPAEAAPLLLAGASADTVPEPGGGRVRAADRLGTADDVEMLVSVLLARTTPLPLAVGLFGDWGSGKSFFMALMHERMQELADLARAAQPQAEPYCREIRQVRFNAWHYVDADLWSSLAATLFDELAQPHDTERAGATVDALERARAEVAEVQDTRERLADEAARLEALLQQPRTAVRASLSAAIRDVREDGRLREHLHEAVRDGGPKAAQTARLIAALEAVEATAGTGRTVWRLVQEELLARRRRATAVTAVVVLAVALAVVALTQLPALAKGAALVTAVLATVAPSLQGALRVLYLAREAREAQERPLLATRHALAEAEAKEAGAVRTVERLERELGGRDASRRLHDFVRERAASSDYRTRLGVISSVRRDFEQLVALLPRQRQERPASDVAAPVPAGPDLPQVDRIILYVDDLDRCPPGKVVEVLQAVHLLLAFELFVVVVGVDSRWLERSLVEHYRDLLVDPDNYLEKIFQIPFSIRPLTGPGYSSLVDGLERARDDASSMRSSTAAEPRVPADVSAEDDVGGGHAVDPPVPDPQPDDGPGTPPRPPVDPPPAPQSLVLTDEERALLGLLGSVIATPRSAKRLMNVYRMLRVSVPPEEAEAFVPGGGREFEAVVVLLGLLVGRPQEAAQAVDVLMATSDDDEVWPVFADFPELLELRSAVTVHRAGPYRRWAPRVFRFSFRRPLLEACCPRPD